MQRAPCPPRVDLKSFEAEGSQAGRHAPEPTVHCSDFREERGESRMEGRRTASWEPGGSFQMSSDAFRLMLGEGQRGRCKETGLTRQPHDQPSLWPRGKEQAGRPGWWAGRNEPLGGGLLPRLTRTVARQMAALRGAGRSERCWGRKQRKAFWQVSVSRKGREPIPEGNTVFHCSTWG